jgi:hypothetical protein
MNVSAAQVFLHHILVQSGHHNADKRPAKKLLQKEALVIQIIKEEDA